MSLSSFDFPQTSNPIGEKSSDLPRTIARSAPARFLGHCLLLGSATLWLLLPTQAKAQSQPNPGILAETPSQRLQRTPEAIPPLPEQQAPNAVITPVNGRVNLRLVNRTGANILYQVIGETQQRILPGRSQVVLQTLATPVNITFYRQDRGFLLVQAQALPNQANTAEISFTETEDFSIDRTTLTVNPKGEVRLN